MSRHILAITLDRQEQARLDAGELIFPEHIDSHVHDIECPAGNGCSGWIECREPHEVNGASASCGPYECDCPDGAPSCLGEPGEDPAPWYDREEFKFHGVLHTWRYGHGWTVPFTGGCIVVHNGFYDLPDEYDSLPIGEHPVEDDWDDESCYLQLLNE